MTKEKNHDLEGKVIGKGENKWKVCRKVGSGACGSVLLLEKCTSSKSCAYEGMQYVIKAAPCAPPRPPKSKKRKKTAIEKNAALISYEHQLYQNVLLSLRGKMVPEIPNYGEVSAYGEVGGYKYLVMEQMAAPIFDVIPSLMMQKKAAINIGCIGVAMIECLEALHNKFILFIDVKPDNFMLAAASSSSTKKQDTASALGKRVRMIDFGLVERFHDISIRDHRADCFPNAQFVGTPLYASLNVLNGHTPSRRDDLESVGYVLGELLLILIQKLNLGDYSNLKKGSLIDQESYEYPSLLPWSDCSSDAEILNTKTREMDDENGKSFFFSNMRAAGSNVERIMREFFTKVRKLDYCNKPDYKSFKLLLSQLEVVLPKLPLKRGSGKTAKQGLVQQDRSRKKKKEEKISKTCGSTSRVRTQPKSSDNITKPKEIDCIDMADDSSESSLEFYDAMEWEHEISPPSSSNTKKMASNIKTPKDGKGIKMLIIIGAHKGEHILLREGSSSAVVVGRGPNDVPKKKNVASCSVNFDLDKDSEASAAHAKFVLYPSRPRCSIRVSDLNSTNGTFVNGRQLRKGTSRQTFVGDKIRLGSSTFELISVQ